MASVYGDLRHLLPGNYKRLITSWLEEDCPSFDYGGFVVGESDGEARLLGKAKVFFPFAFYMSNGGTSTSRSTCRSLRAKSIHLSIGSRCRCSLRG
jgi:hypothetical protein